jgi:hypothetical protein
VRVSYRLSNEYVTTAAQDVPLQLSKARVRLAFVPNNCFAHTVPRIEIGLIQPVVVETR